MERSRKESRDNRESKELTRSDTGHEQSRGAKRAWRMFRPVLVFLISAAICAAILVTAYKKITARLFSPVDIYDATPVEITISSGSGASAIAKKLYEAGGVDENGDPVAPGLISSKTLFKIYVDFTGKSSKLKAGTYVLSRNMDIEQIVEVICAGNPPRTTLKLVITEGMTVEEIANKLVSLGVLKDGGEFMELCRTGAQFRESYPFVAQIPEDPRQQRDYALEGYLFPDTYDIYSDESAQSVIGRMLTRFQQIMNEAYMQRAEEINMSLDDVVTLASLIEKEARQEDDFARVSAVFHNRLGKNMRLQSDAPLKYIFHTSGVLNFSAEQMADTSLYNTHVYEGLPLGPISNPGQKAIDAALYPSKEYTEGEYLYFCLKDSETGELVYAKTLEEHNENVAKYRPNW